MAITKSAKVQYRLYTEDVSPTDDRLDGIGITPEVLFAGYVVNFTVYRAKGYWSSGRENALVFEVVGDEGLSRFVLNAAEEICSRCGQDTVIVTAEPVTQHLITKD